MAFVFHKSKQALTWVTLKEIVKEDKSYRDKLLFLQIQFRSSSIKQKSCTVDDNGYESANL